MTTIDQIRAFERAQTIDRITRHPINAERVWETLACGLLFGCAVLALIVF